MSLIKKNGYVVPFQRPPPFSKERVPFQLLVVSPLSVAQNKGSGKMRLILYLSEQNNFVEKKKVKFEDWKIALI